MPLIRVSVVVSGSSAVGDHTYDQPYQVLFTNSELYSICCSVGLFRDKY